MQRALWGRPYTLMALPCGLANDTSCGGVVLAWHYSNLSLMELGDGPNALPRHYAITWVDVNDCYGPVTARTHIHTTPPAYHSHT